MNTREPLVSKALTAAIVICGLVYILVYMAIVSQRIQYPFELEWMEGGSLDHVLRILAGKQIYVAPSIEFVPFMYTPVYYYVAALFSWVIGPGFLPLRLVSFLASLGCLWVIFWWVKRETGRAVPGVVAASLFAATYRIGGAWFDLARVDSLFLFLLLASVYAIRFWPSTRGTMLAAVLASLAFLTKQVGLVALFPMALYLWLTHKSRAYVFLGVSLCLSVLMAVVLDSITLGWFLYYLFLPMNHSSEWVEWFAFWFRDLIKPFPVAVGLIVILGLMRKKLDHEAFYFYFFAGFALLGISFVSRLHVGGWDNVLLPAYAIVSVMTGLAVHYLTARDSGANPELPYIMPVAVSVLILCQFLSLSYNPFKQIPTKADLAAGLNLVEQIRHYPGDVYVPYHPYVASMAGKRPYAHRMAVWDVLRSHDTQISAILEQEIRDAIENRSFDCIIVQQDPNIENLMESFYRKECPTFGDKEVFWPVAGKRTRPDDVHVP
ncbi:MAG: glycosyltransferase family 39 protein [Deltaproteobacteria bacterium]